MLYINTFEYFARIVFVTCTTMFAKLLTVQKTFVKSGTESLRFMNFNHL
jgi:hypothetical protein